MEDDPSKLGYEKNPSVWEKYIGIGHWTLIHRVRETHAGKLVRIEDGMALLDPFQGVVYDSKKGLIRKIINRVSVVSIGDDTSMEPTTRKSVEAFCKYMNKQDDVRREEEEKERERRNHIR